MSKTEDQYNEMAKMVTFNDHIIYFCDEHGLTHGINTCICKLNQIARNLRLAHQSFILTEERINLERERSETRREKEVKRVNDWCRKVEHGEFKVENNEIKHVKESCRICGKYVLDCKCTLEETMKWSDDHKNEVRYTL